MLVSGNEESRFRDLSCNVGSALCVPTIHEYPSGVHYHPATIAPKHVHHLALLLLTSNSSDVNRSDLLRTSELTSALKSGVRHPLCRQFQTPNGDERLLGSGQSLH
jgi:hypothetical protein